MRSEVRPGRDRRRAARAALRLALLTSFAFAGGCVPQVPTSPRRAQQVIDSPDAAIRSLGEAYARRDYEQFASHFIRDPSVPYLFILSEPLPSGQTVWGIDEELHIHRRMFQPDSVPPGEAPVPDSLWLAGITISLSPQRVWEERPDLYRSVANPQGLDPDRWKAFGAPWHAVILFDTQGNTDYSVDDTSYFVVIEDRSKEIGMDGKFLVYRWEDFGVPAPKAAGVEPTTWSGVKVLYRPHAASRSPSELIAELGEAYRTQDYRRYAALFPDEPGGPDFLFVLNEPLPGGETYWGLTEELRIHKRMFDPQNLPPGEPPVPDSLWLNGIAISLTPNRDWEERPDLYRSPQNPAGLDPARWKVVGAEWHAVLFVETQGNMDYSADGKSYFYVIDDLSKQLGDDRKFQIYRWEDLGIPWAAGGKAATEGTWSRIKSVYR